MAEQYYLISDALIIAGPEETKGAIINKAIDTITKGLEKPASLKIVAEVQDLGKWVEEIYNGIKTQNNEKAI